MLELDDGTRIDEVMAICRYFEDVYPEPPLLGRNALEKAVITNRQRKMEFDGMIARLGSVSQSARKLREA